MAYMLKICFSRQLFDKVRLHHVVSGQSLFSRGCAVSSENNNVVIVGAGLAGLACARRLMQDDVPFILLAGAQKIGGRLKTENVNGYLFRIRQTSTPQ